MTITTHPTRSPVPSPSRPGAPPGVGSAGALGSGFSATAVPGAATAVPGAATAVPGAAARVISVPDVGAGVEPRRALARRCGILEPFLLLSGITDVFLSATSGLWFDRGRGAERDPELAPPERVVRALASRLIALGGRHVDEATPCVDVRLEGGIRVHAVLPPIATRGTELSIRLPAITPLSLDELEERGSLGTPDAARRIRALVRERRNVLISGATGSGKTTLLAALLGAADPRERIVAVEDVAELTVDHPRFIGLQSRQANVDGAGELGLQRLLREALRMRPDRLVLGECRGAEIRELCGALNTGHDGGAGTLHANSLADVPARIEALGALAGLGPGAIAAQAHSAIHLVIHLARAPERSVVAIGGFEIGPRGRLEVRPQWVHSRG